jgi:uncharacterized membrane protein YphA (DoxX/SURF4 family)
MSIGVRVYGLGAILLGLIGLAFGDFALQWQPVPEGLAAHQALAYASAAILLLAGLALWAPRFVALGAGVLTLVFGAWVVVLHGPLVLAHPGRFLPWQGVAEIAAITCGALVAFASAAPPDPGLAGGLRVAGRVVFGVCLLIFGVSHLLYAKFTAAMVPAWIPPSQMFWTYATAAGHFAAGLALVSGVQARLAARLVTLMFAAFVVTLHAPLVAASPHSHLNWTMLAITLAMAGAAWVVSEAGTSRR